MNEIVRRKSWTEQLSDESKVYHRQLLSSPQFRQLVAEFKDISTENVPKWHPSRPMSEADHAFLCGTDDGIEVILQFLNGDFYGNGDET